MTKEKDKMIKDVMLSLNPQWIKPIMTGRKTFEVRKRAPLQRHPYKVYLYCTKGGEELWLAGILDLDTGKVKRESALLNGTVCGEFTCVNTTEYTPPWIKAPIGTCLTAKELYAYQGTATKLCFMRIENPVLYDKPKSLEDFGLHRAPQSWQYIGR